MVRISSSVTAKRRKKRVLKEAKGYFAKRATNFKQAKKTRIKAMQWATRDRRAKKRHFRSLWIVRVKAACLQEGMAYSRFINALMKAKIEINRKMLAEMAVSSPEIFKKLVEIAKLQKA